MDWAPQWILDKAVAKEIENAWDGASTEVLENDVPPHANVISFHAVYKVKNEEKDQKRMKIRLCPHKNRDKEKGNIRNDSANAYFDFICILLSLACIRRLRLGCVDIKRVYLQSGPITRDL